MINQSPLELGLECLRTQKIDEAIEHLEEATALFAQDYKALNYLGVAYAKKGLYDRAVGSLLAALNLRPNVASIHYNLGLAFQADGFPEKAREHFQHALGLDPEYEKAVVALKTLDAQAVESLSSQSCARHSDESATGVCSFCHLPVCKKCKTIVGDQVYCSSCAPKQG